MSYKKASNAGKVRVPSQSTGDLPTGDLMEELHKLWRTQASLPPAEARNFRPRENAGFSQYIGRPVLSKTLGYVLGKWEEIAAEYKMNFRAVRPPIGIRYLGPSTLQAIKYCSKHGQTEEGDVIPNSFFEPVRAVGQIIDRAFADTLNLDTGLASDNVVNYGTRLAVRQYSKEDSSGTHLVVTGVSLSETDSLKWNPTTDLAAERGYFVTRYDPYYDPEQNDPDWILKSSVYVPLGVIDGLRGVSDERFQDMAAVCQTILPIKTVLGHVQLIEEANVTVR